MNTLSLGPFFTQIRSIPTGNPKIIPLNIASEWANPDRAQATPLFQHSPSGDKRRPALHEIVFPAEAIPCNVRCQEFQVVDTPAGSYVPLDALLVTLYQNGFVSRSIFGVLAELAALVPLHSFVSNPPKDAEGLLLPSIEQKGFRITNVIPEEDKIFVDIGWYPEPKSAPFHTCICAFAHTAGKLAEGEWLTSPMIGVHQLLATELRRMATGDLGKALTEKGRQYLEELSEPTAPQIHAKPERHENSVESRGGEPGRDPIE